MLYCFDDILLGICGTFLGIFFHERAYRLGLTLPFLNIFFLYLVFITILECVTCVTWWHAFSPIPIFQFFFFSKNKKIKSVPRKNFKNTRHTRHTRHSLIIHLIFLLFYYHLWFEKAKNIIEVGSIEWWRQKIESKNIFLSRQTSAQCQEFKGRN